MTDSQWNQLLAVLRGEPLDPLPVGFIIDSPWLPQWCGHDIADYLNRKALHQAITAIEAATDEPTLVSLKDFIANAAKSNPQEENSNH